MKTIFTTPILLASLLLGFATTAIASEGDSCYSELAGLAGHIRDDICVPPYIFAGSAWGRVKGMRYITNYLGIAVDAGRRGDYDTALLNFERAIQALRSNPVDPREAKSIKRELDRGYKAASNAKEAMKRGDINAAYRTWVTISGWKKK
ncbi:hypothetical protein BCD67_08920 [Oscillatoriales cyanobacterium USR001]|nr:hypothetical protein BCD67_08920 [Oscillatoriales cyanobacterium USR001]